MELIPKILFTVTLLCFSLAFVFHFLGIDRLYKSKTNNIYFSISELLMALGLFVTLFSGLLYVWST